MSRHRILIVDDDEDVRKVMVTALSSRYEVVQASDGLDALHKLEDYQPDFAIIDGMMPLMDGYQLCEAVRRHENFKAIPVLFLSAYGNKENIRKGYAAGANLYMTKPIDPLRVLKNVEFTINHEKPDIRKKRYTLKELQERETDYRRESGRDGGAPRARGNGQDRAAERPEARPRPSAPPPPPRASQPRPEPSRPAPPPRPTRPAPTPPPPPPSYGPIADSEEIELDESIRIAPTTPRRPPDRPVPTPPPSPAVEMPRAAPPPPAAEPGLHPPVYRRPDRGPIPRVMIVDNEDEVRDIIDLALRGKYEVTTARDGVEAIENIVLYQPDMMIVDIMMPKMNGYQLIQTMRRNVAYKDLPIIVVSGKATARDQAYVERLGANAFIAKPFEIDQLVAKVDELTAAPTFRIGEKRLPIHEIVEREFLKAKERTEAADQKDRQKKFSELQEILNEDSRRQRQGS